MLIWDLPTRLYHWSQSFLFVLLIITGFSGNGPHIYLGLALFSLLLWRVLWGVVGSQTSRFKQFLRSPKVIVNFIKGKHKQTPGHNPLGGWMVTLMISTLLLQCLSGMVLADIFSGSATATPWLNDNLMDTAEIAHAASARFLMLLVIIHLSAIIIHKLMSRHLVLAMFTGYQTHFPKGGYDTEEIKIASNTRASVVFIACILLTITIVSQARI